MDTGNNRIPTAAGVVGLVALKAAVGVFGFDTVAMTLMLAGLVGMLIGVAVYDRWPSAAPTDPAALAVGQGPVARRSGRSPLHPPRG
jgi:hypothetical protein